MKTLTASVYFVESMQLFEWKGLDTRRRLAKNALEDNDRPNDNDEKSTIGEQNTGEKKTMEIPGVADVWLFMNENQRHDIRARH